MLTELDVYYLFLSRPRRFGKTLLLDTLNELFLGRRHLFENLWISRETDYDFQPHPVIRLSMNYSVTDSPEKLKNYIIGDLLETAESMEVTINKTEYDSILEELLKKLSKKHSAGAAVLIDKYDAPVPGILTPRTWPGPTAKSSMGFILPSRYPKSTSVSSL
jgi:hypothetical protein